MPIGRVERLERQIAARRMTAALDTDWDQLHHRSREIAAQLTEDGDPARQIATGCSIRSSLRRTGDLAGLRALRLAAAGPMAGWLQHQSARPAAQSFGRQLANDQREAIPELASLEDALSEARQRR